MELSVATLLVANNLTSSPNTIVLPFRLTDSEQPCLSTGSFTVTTIKSPSSSSLELHSFMLVCVLPLPTLMKATLPKAISLIASGETGPIHMAACGAASRDYVFDGPEF
jgi:hypothetical protein